MVLENWPAVLLPIWLLCPLALSRKPSQFCFGSKAVWTPHVEYPHISLSGFGEGPLPGYVDGAFIKPMGQLEQQGFGADPAQSCHFTRKEGRGEGGSWSEQPEKSLFQWQDSKVWRDMKIRRRGMLRATGRGAIIQEGIPEG